MIPKILLFTFVVVRGMEAKRSERLCNYFLKILKILLDIFGYQETVYFYLKTMLMKIWIMQTSFFVFSSFSLSIHS